MPPHPSPQDYTVVILLYVFNRILPDPNPLDSTVPALLYLLSQMLPNPALLAQTPAVIRPNHPSQTSQVRFNEFAEGSAPTPVPSQTSMSAQHHQTSPCEVFSVNLLGQSICTDILSEVSLVVSNQLQVYMGTSLRTRKIKKQKKNILPRSPRKRPKKRNAAPSIIQKQSAASEIQLPRRIKTRQQQGYNISQDRKSLNYDNQKKDLQKKAVDYWDYILRVQKLKTDRFRKKRYLAACLQVSCLKIQDYFTEQVYGKLMKGYFEWLDKKIAYECEIWNLKDDPISRRTIDVYLLAEDAIELLQQGKWFQSIKTFFDNRNQRKKLKGNIIFFLKELAVFNGEIESQLEKCGDLQQKTLLELEKILIQLQPYQPESSNQPEMSHQPETSHQLHASSGASDNRIDQEANDEDSSEQIEESSSREREREEFSSISALIPGPGPMGHTEPDHMLREESLFDVLTFSMDRYQEYK